MSRFDQAVSFVMDNEGYWSDNPQDKGGCTCWGLTLADMARYPRLNITTCDELKRLTVADAKEAYFVLYWDTRLAQIKDARITTKLFDMKVNLGESFVVLAQRAAVQCGQKIKTDGLLGLQTINAINSIEPSTYLDELVQQLYTYYDRIVEHNPSQVVFIKGWHSRAKRLPIATA